MGLECLIVTGDSTLIGHVQASLGAHGASLQLRQDSASAIEFVSRRHLDGIVIDCDDVPGGTKALPEPRKALHRPGEVRVVACSHSGAYATMVHVAAFTGLRASELIGLRWKNVHADSITVEERYCRGEWGAPKSKASNATIPVNGQVIDRIHRLKTITVEIRAGNALRRYPAVKSCGPDDLVFASVATGAPMRDNTILTRFIKPAARALGMGWVNWQVLRRSHATWLKMAGADVKDAQAQMRHSRATTTLEVYQQFTPESQRRAVNRLMDLTGTGFVN